MRLIDDKTCTFEQPYGKHTVIISRVLEDEIPTPAEAEGSDMFIWPNDIPYDMTWEDYISRILSRNIKRILVVHPRPPKTQKGILEQIEEHGSKSTYESLTYEKLERVIKDLMFK